MRTDRSIVVVSPARIVSAGYLVVRKRPEMVGGSAAFAAAIDSVSRNPTASIRRNMLGPSPFAGDKTR